MSVEVPIADKPDFDSELKVLRERVFAARQVAATAQQEMVDCVAAWFADYAIGVARKNVERQHLHTEELGAQGVKALRDGVRATDWKPIVRKAFAKPELMLHVPEEPSQQAIQVAWGVSPSHDGRQTTLQSWEQAPVREVVSHLSRVHGYEPHIYSADLRSSSATLRTVSPDVRRQLDAFAYDDLTCRSVSSA